MGLGLHSGQEGRIRILSVADLGGLAHFELYRVLALAWKPSGLWIPGLSRALHSSVLKNWDRQSESMKATKKDRSARLAKLSAAGDKKPSHIQRKIQNADE